MTSSESVISMLKESDTVWQEVYERLTDENIGGRIKGEDLFYWYDKNLGRNLIIDAVERGVYRWSVPRKVALVKAGTTKKRVVYIYSNRDRYVQGVLCKAIALCYDSKVHTDCYSYRTGVSTTTAVRKTFANLDLNSMYVLKVDISAYFYSVRRDKILNLLNHIFLGDNAVNENDYLATNLLNILKPIYEDDRVWCPVGELNGNHRSNLATEDERNTFEAVHNMNSDRFHLINEFKSLTAGSSFSGFLANCLLYDLDEHISKIEGIKYARYSDDILIAHESKSVLIDILAEMREMLAEYGLEINNKKVSWFEKDDIVTFLGIKAFDNNRTSIQSKQSTDETSKIVYDLGDETVSRFKKFIKDAAKKTRRKLECRKVKPSVHDLEIACIKLFKLYNQIMYKCYIEDKRKFGWAFYAFRCINTIETLRLLDFYIKDTVRYVYSGKHNKYNIIRVPDEKLKEFGYVSLVDMLTVFKTDFDLYKDTVAGHNRRRDRKGA